MAWKGKGLHWAPKEGNFFRYHHYPGREWKGGICIIATHCRIRLLLYLPATTRDRCRRHLQLFDRTGCDHHTVLAPHA